jgi:hypothetical protein
VVYELPENATAGTLTFPIAPTTATTPAATLQLCPLAHPAIQLEQGGPMGDAPSFDCTTSVQTGPNAAATAYQFNAAGLVRDGNLAVAILPTTPTDRVVLSPPDSNSLEVTFVPVSSAQASEAAIEPAANDVVTPSDFGSVPVVAADVISAPVVTPATPSTVVTTPAHGDPLLASAVSGPGRANAWLVALALATLLSGASLWAYAGRDRGEGVETS